MVIYPLSELPPALRSAATALSYTKTYAMSLVPLYVTKTGRDPGSTGLPLRRGADSFFWVSREVPDAAGDIISTKIRLCRTCGLTEMVCG